MNRHVRPGARVEPVARRGRIQAPRGVQRRGVHFPNWHSGPIVLQAVDSKSVAQSVALPGTGYSISFGPYLHVKQAEKTMPVYGEAQRDRRLTLVYRRT